jgi:hypothetical protein
MRVLDYIAGMSVLRQTAAVVLVAMMWGGTQSRGQSAREAADPAEKTTGAAPAEEPVKELVPADMCRLGPTEAQKGSAHFPSYLNDSFSQLKAEVPLLRGLKFEADPAGEPETSQSILSKTGETITTMLPRVPNLIAKEELAQAALKLPYVVTETVAQNAGTGGARRNAAQLYDSSSHGVEGEELQKVLDGMLSNGGKHPVFSYRIQSSVDPTYGTVLNEYRTTAENEAVDISNMSPGNPRGVGFSSTWMMFKPANVEESRYRYLGHQKVGKHETVVLAFAQIPGEVQVPPAITIPGSSPCSYLMQGVVWIDDSIFQIVRIQTDLLAPLTDLNVSKLNSEVSFGEVRIAERNLTLWMPDDVEIRWLLKDQAGAERHKYSDYRLFGATSRIVLP